MGQQEVEKERGVVKKVEMEKPFVLSCSTRAGGEIKGGGRGGGGLVTKKGRDGGD